MARTTGFDQRERDLKEREVAIGVAERAQAGRFAAQFKRELDWITLMLIANRSIFRRSEPATARQRRKIMLQDQDDAGR